MKQKDYKKKRQELKEEKRKTVKRFDHAESKKRYIDDVKRTYRSLKRSERQAILKQIEDDLKD